MRDIHRAYIDSAETSLISHDGHMRDEERTFIEPSIMFSKNIESGSGRGAVPGARSSSIQGKFRQDRTDNRSNLHGKLLRGDHVL